MNPLRLWMRRGAGILVPVTLGPLLLLTLVPGHRWYLDADWGLRNAAVVVGFYTPVLAAIAAFDASRRLHPTLAMVGRSGSRGWGVTLVPPGAALAWTVLLTVTAWVGVVATAVGSGGIAPVDWWIAPETLLAYAAALAVGQWIGSMVRGVLAPVLAAVLVIVATLPTGVGVRALQVATTTGTMVGLDRTPSRALVSIGVDASILLLFAGLTIATNRGRARPRSAVLAALVLPLVITLGLSVRSPAEEFQPTQAATVCVGSSPRVCGPTRTERLLTIAQRDLAQATSALAASGLTPPSQYAIARGDAARALGPGITQLPIELSSLTRNHLPRAALIDALAQPRLCAALYTAQSAEEYIELADMVSSWIGQQLALPGGPTGPAPADVQDANRRLNECPLP